MIETDARQAAAFANPLRVRVLMACALEPRSLTALRRLTEAPLAKLHYHVSRLLAAKLLGVSATQPRGGRPIKFYRAVGDSFIVPHECLPALPGERLSARLRQALRDEQSRSGGLSLRYAPAPGGNVTVTLVPQAPAPPSRSLELWRVMHLDARQRAAFAQDLANLLRRYADAAPEPGAEPLLVHAAFAPR